MADSTTTPTSATASLSTPEPVASTSASSASTTVPEIETTTEATSTEKCETCGADKKSDTSTADAPAADAPAEEAPKEPEGKVEEHDKYVLRWQIWDKDNSKWNPYDPAKASVTPEIEYPNAHFIVNQRYMNAWSDPELVITNWSPRLLGFLRAVVGDDFFEDDPAYPVTKLFVEVKQMRQKQARAKELLTSKGYLDIAEKVKEVEDFGYLEATKPTTSWTMCKTYLTDLIEHLEPFMAYMNEQFEPIEKKLARMREYGQMEFELLLYHFEPGQKLVYFDCPSGRPDAFVLTERHIETDWQDTRWMILRGTAYRFDGDGYSERHTRRKIKDYKGTQSVNSLAAMELTPTIEEALKKRGQLYTSLAGVYHKDYEGKRVILDPKAYENRDGYVRDPKAVVQPLEEDKLYLLPADIEGFNLANKVCQECQRLGYACPADECQTWQRFDITKIKDVVFDENAWEHLVLDEDTKLLIEALVRVTDNANTYGTIISDVISGKGGGLISVLHGPPGTGKTLTAESVAEHLHRPMYMVGFTELSTSPDDLENNLRKILRLATAWDAVLLIDEADVFLEQRSLHELERNALVSVALRLLEYHRGVLFLTTNRITTFDEAFLSRFSIAIKYHELDHAGRLAVWKKFFDLAGYRMEGSEDEFTTVEANGTTISAEELDELAEKPFNGRTIKNLVRTAQALALSQKKPLSVEHVKTVVRVQEKFLREFGATNLK